MSNNIKFDENTILGCSLEFVINSQKISNINKIFEILDIDFVKLKDFEKISFEENVYKLSLSGFVFFNEKIKKQKYDNSDILLLLIYFDKEQYNPKDELNVIDLCQNFLKDKKNCSYCIITFKNKSIVIKKIIFNNITTFITVNN